MEKPIFIVGPTAAGKTKLALELAAMEGGAILNGDSIQLYRRLNIGSAKPDLKNHPNIPHYLFDQVPPPSVWTAGDYRREALRVLRKELPKRKVFIPGGSGFYIQALDKGMYPLAAPKKEIIEELKAVQAEKGLNFLYRKLQKEDPERAQEISPQDHYRILRSLSVIQSEGRLFSEVKKEFSAAGGRPSGPGLKIGLSVSRQELQERVRARTRSMLKRGLIEETESLLNQGFENWRPLQSIGYREAVLFLKGRLNRESLHDQIVRSTLALARKQKKWFQRDPDIVWHDFKTPASEIYEKSVVAKIRGD